MSDQYRILETLFESVAKVRLLRLFMQNYRDQFTIQEIADRTQLKPPTIRREIKKLLKIDLVKEKFVSDPQKVNRTSKRTSGKKDKPAAQRAIYFSNTEFPLFTELQDLVTKSYIASRKQLTNEIKKLGQIKLAVISGIFVDDEKARTDILIIGDHIERRKLDNFLMKLESELGRTLQYTTMETTEFRYRMNMYDRFLRDIFEFPHEKIINKLSF